MLARLNKLQNWQAAIVIAVVGLAVFSIGLNNQFVGDDFLQIVNNPVVHSIRHAKLLFEGSTFYVGKGLTPLYGDYFRPLMTTAFSLIYTAFGPHPFYFHAIQLLLCIGSSIILYLFFRYSFHPLLSLLLALVFLVHPIDSQVVFAIASMQDALFFFFGILALYLLLRFKSSKSLALVALCLLLSLLAKETGVLFVVMAGLYLLIFDQRRRFFMFVCVMVLPVAVYLLLKVHAVGLFGANPHNAPIDNVGLSGRLFTMPSVVMFYLTKVVFPFKLSSSYYWVYPSFSVAHFVLPLVVDLTVLGIFIYTAVVIRRRAPRSEYVTYLFFFVWLVLGLLAHLQLIPLDMTICEAWFYFSMAGLLGMVGTVWKVFKPHISPSWLLIATVIIVTGLGIRSAMRGLEWSNQYKLAMEDITNSSSNFAEYNIVASYYVEQANFGQAERFAQKSISIYPMFTNYNNLGLALAGQGDYADAVTAYDKGLKYGQYNAIYEGIGELTLVYGNPTTDRLFLISALQKYPEDPSLWMYYAILEDRQGNPEAATAAIRLAAKYGQVPQALYDSIVSGQPLTLKLPDLKDTVSIN